MAKTVVHGADAAAGPPPVEQDATCPAPDRAEAPSSSASLRPLVEHPWPVERAALVNLALAAPGVVRLGGAFSFMCTFRMDAAASWCRLFDFSLNADLDSITAGAIELTRDLHFTIFRGRRPFSVRVNNFFTFGQERALLCTVSVSGHMMVYRDGELVGENKEGMSPLRVERPNMIVGGHGMLYGQDFLGTIKDVKVWDQEVLAGAGDHRGAACLLNSRATP